MKVLNSQDLIDLVDGAAIFSAGGGGSPEGGYNIVKELNSKGFEVKLLNPSEIPDDAKIVNFACVGATTAVEYNAEAAVKTLKILEKHVNESFYATIPVELGGFNTLVAVDVAARCGIPVVNADGAGRAVPEVHLKVYTIDEIPLAPMVVADVDAKNIVIVEKTADLKAAERIARVLASEWNQSAYTARRILTGLQVKTKAVQLTLSKCIKIGKILRKAVEPIKAVLRETKGFKLFEGIVEQVKRHTEAGFTFVNVKLRGIHEFKKEKFEFKAKNEILAAYRNGKLSALAPDIITPVHYETGKCVTAEKIGEGDKLVVLGISSPAKWRTEKGLKLWREVLQSAGIFEEYKPIEKLVSSF